MWKEAYSMGLFCGNDSVVQRSFADKVVCDLCCGNSRVLWALLLKESRITGLFGGKSLVL